MNRLRLCSLVVLLAFASPAFAQKPTTGPWDMKALAVVEVKPEWGKDAGKAREVYYAGEDFKGKPTRVFAYYGVPERRGQEKLPAMVLIHGGGGRSGQQRNCRMFPDERFSSRHL